MLKTGLLSITFRKLSCEEIVDLAAQAGLDGLEWGGDVHVPHGDVQQAERVKQMTERAGLSIAAYGSYYRVGTEHADQGLFEQVLASAEAMDAPTIRVWAGDLGSDKADEAWWNTVVSDSRRIADMAQQKGITVSYEYHGHTLTDTNASALRLLQEVNHPNIRTLWQPPVPQSFEERKEGLKQMLPWLTNLHVFQWQGTDRKPLAKGEKDWLQYFEIASDQERYVMLEFVKDDRPEQFLDDARTLKQFVKQVEEREE